MKINGLELPTALQSAIKNSIWMSRSDKYSSRWHKKDHIDLFALHFPMIDAPLPELFDYDNMLTVNELLTGPKDILDFYTGTQSNEYPPGNIDPLYTVIIGGSEPDSPIALDYRSTTPKVVYFCEIEYVSYWVEAFKSIEDMLFALELVGT